MTKNLRSRFVPAVSDLARLQNHAIEKRPIDLGALTRDALADFSPSALNAGIELAGAGSSGACRGPFGRDRVHFS
jgi:hypothetical protein